MSTIPPFEYAMVLVSIVLGLGIAQMLAGVGDLLQHASRLRVYGPYLAWLPLVFFLQIQAWWLFYGLRERAVWHLPVFLFAMLYPIGLYILTRMMFPAMGGDGPVVLREFYFARYRTWFPMVALLALVTVAENTWLARIVHEPSCTMRPKGRSRGALRHASGRP